MKANVQLKSSIPIGAKVEISSQGLYIRSQVCNRFFFFFSICPKLLTLWLCISPRAEKMNTIGLGKPICNSWGPMFQQLFIKILDINVLLAFISNLGPKQQSKNAQSWPYVSSALTPSVNGA
jgi:hypothetical protein